MRIEIILNKIKNRKDFFNNYGNHSHAYGHYVMFSSQYGDETLNENDFWYIINCFRQGLLTKKDYLNYGRNI